MSENTTPQVRAEEPELADNALEQVAGGCTVDSQLMDPQLTVTKPILILTTPTL
ncbi:MAG TPA: hypothetical protein VF665_03025 [Longimicrobium sp.]|jgi:hypothetical protein|uniref:hypothetical protein n=1 Tax=Longimicrobium sp. TaxID=2029185 RepID=UPI002ED90E45